MIERVSDEKYKINDSFVFYDDAKKLKDDIIFKIIKNEIKLIRVV